MRTGSDGGLGLLALLSRPPGSRAMPVDNQTPRDQNPCTRIDQLVLDQQIIQDTRSARSEYAAGDYRSRDARSSFSERPDKYPPAPILQKLRTNYRHGVRDNISGPWQSDQAWNLERVNNHLGDDVVVDGDADSLLVVGRFVISRPSRAAGSGQLVVHHPCVHLSFLIFNDFLKNPKRWCRGLGAALSALS